MRALAVDPTIPQPIPLEIIKSMSGLDVLRGMIDGSLPPPPICKTLDFRIIEAGRGTAIFSCTPQMMHFNPIGSVHGGLAGTLLDSCMSCAVMSELEKGFGYTTLEYRVHLVRAMTDRTGPVRAEGRVVHSGKRTATAEGSIVDSNGALYAHGTTTCLIISLG